MMAEKPAGIGARPDATRPALLSVLQNRATTTALRSADHKANHREHQRKAFHTPDACAVF